MSSRSVRKAELVRAAQEVVTAYYVQIHEDGLGAEQADWALGEAVERLWQMVGEVPQ